MSVNHVNSYFSLDLRAITHTNVMYFKAFLLYLKFKTQVPQIVACTVFIEGLCKDSFIHHFLLLCWDQTKGSKHVLYRLPPSHALPHIYSYSKSNTKTKPTFGMRCFSEYRLTIRLELVNTMLEITCMSHLAYDLSLLLVLDVML